MGFLVSPGVDINEVDITNVVPAVTTSIGGIVGKFRWGPADELITVGSEKELSATFGKPSDADFAEDYFNAAGFLTYGNNLKVFREASTSKNASASADGTIQSVTVTSKGSGYIVVPALSGSGGSGTEPTLVPVMEISDFKVRGGPDTALAGTGYQVGDVVTIDIGTGTEATFRIDAVSGTTPTTVSLLNRGEYTALSLSANDDSPSAGEHQLTETNAINVTGSGSGLLIDNITLRLKSVTISDVGARTGAYALTVAAPTGTDINKVGTSDSPAAADATATVSVQMSSSQQIKNETAFDGLTLGSGLGNFVARYPGALGNSLSVAVVTNASFGVDTTTTITNFDNLEDIFDGAPGTDGSSVNQIHIAVIDQDGDITGVANTILETYQFVSKTATDKADDGSTNYYVNIINERSEWIYANPNSIVNVDNTNHTNTALSGGTDVKANKATLATAYTTAFKNTKDTVDVNLIIGGAYPSAQCNTIIEAASHRKDAVAFVSPELDDTQNVATQATALTNVTGWAAGVNSSSYGILDSSSIVVYDKYNDVNRHIAAAGHIAGLCANTDDVADSWFSPAGFNRGGLRSVVKLAFNPDQTRRDELYRKRINPIVSFPGQGIVLFGDKTAQTKASAFDRINVRRLFITLEKAVATAAKFQLFELNDEFTRAQFRNLVEPFLRDVKGRRGITDFLVVCDETNNTAEVIDGNRFAADIYIKPARSINFITLNFIATRTGVEFSEIVGTN